MHCDVSIRVLVALLLFQWHQRYLPIDSTLTFYCAMTKKNSESFSGAVVALSSCAIPDGRLVSQCRAGAVPGAAPCRASPSVHWPQLLPQGRGPWVPSLQGADSRGRQGGRAEEGPVLPQQPPWWPYVGPRVQAILRPVRGPVQLPGGWTKTGYKV